VDCTPNVVSREVVLSASVHPIIHLEILASNVLLKSLRCERIVEQRVAEKELLVLLKALFTSVVVKLVFKEIRTFVAAQIAPARLTTTARWIRLASIDSVKIRARCERLAVRMLSVASFCTRPAALAHNATSADQLSSAVQILDVAPQLRDLLL